MSCRAIVLVGLRGTGKTTVGRALANRLGWAFVDTDELLAAAVGKPAGAWLEEVGETAFRESEAAVVVPLLATAARTVIATGGGAILTAAVRQALVDPALFPVWLTASTAVLHGRLAASTELRPALTALAPAAEIDLLRTRRDGHYALVSKFAFDTALADPAACAAAIESEFLRSNC